ncbi:hypothetical protein CKA32_000569 [Geitlerinema sp. FC II]|nr:hypothetical protein CKA32_000569 [Geitlerinema sp. FC II]
MFFKLNKSLIFGGRFGVTTAKLNNSSIQSKATELINLHF